MPDSFGKELLGVVLGTTTIKHQQRTQRHATHTLIAYRKYSQCDHAGTFPKLVLYSFSLHMFSNDHVRLLLQRPDQSVRAANWLNHGSIH